MPNLFGNRDPRGMEGILARGNNVYPGGTNNAGHAGGRPSTGQINPLAAQRLLNRDRNNPGAEAMSNAQPLPGGNGSAPQTLPMSPTMALAQASQNPWTGGSPRLTRAATDPSSQQRASGQRQNMMNGIPPQLANMLASLQMAAQRRLMGG